MKPVFRIIMKAIVIVALGTMLLLIAGVWGQNQMMPISNKELLLAGVAGTSLVVLALTYSLRKRFRMWGKLNTWLRFHEVTALSGTALIVWHSGLRIHNAIGWVALVLMLVLCVSGIVGRYLHIEISREFARRKKVTDDQSALGQLQWWRDHFQYWRKIHVPMTKVTFLVLSIHLFATAFYGGWQP